MKRYFTKIATFIICLCIGMSFFADAEVLAATDPRLIDDADILTAEEEITLTAMLDRISDEVKCDVVIVTVDDMGVKTPQAFADDYMDYNGYGYNDGEDCVLLAVGMFEGAYHFSTRGFAMDAFNSDAVENMENCIEKHLSDSAYYDAFVEFAEISEDYLAGARNGNYYKAPFSLLGSIIIAVVIGFIIALISVSVMKASLKSVRSKYTASGYEKKGSMKITKQRDIYLYRTITRTPRPQNNGSGGEHRSSSGRSHGGGGGRF